MQFQLQSFVLSIKVRDHVRFRLLWMIQSFFAISLLIGICSQTAAQPYTIRPIFGTETGALLSIRRNPGVINHTSTSGRGRSYSNGYWLGIEMEWDRPQDDLWNWLLRFGVGFAHGQFVSNPYEGYSTIDTGTLEPVKSSLEFDVVSTQMLIHCDALAGFHPFPGALLVAGPWGRFRASSATLETERSLNSDSVMFPESKTRQRTIGSGKGIESFPFRGGLFAGLGYDLTLSKAITIRPVVAARCDAEALISGLGARALSFEGSLSVKFDFTSDDITEGPVRDILVDTTALLAAVSSIDASVDIFNLDTSSGSRDLALIRAQRTIHRQYVPLSPVIYFDVGSDVIPSRYNLAQSGNDAILESSRTHVEALDVHRNLLNILGKRMRENSELTMSLSSELAKDESITLGRVRAERIKEYLSKIWGIQESRIRIEPLDLKRTSTEVGAPVVIVNTSEPVLLTPTVSQWMIDDHTLPHIGLSKGIQSRLGVKSWKLMISQNGRHITQLSHEDIAGEINATLPLSPLNVDSTSSPLIAELTVQDYNGFSKSVTDHLDVKLDRGTKVPSREIRIFYFFEPRPAFPSSAISNKALIEKIASTTRNGARITIISGPLAHRERWSGAVIAKEVLSVLNTRSINLSELHLKQSTDASASSSPDEKLFDRAVRVTVEQALPPGGEEEQ